jgi:YVTN family beta-propeller protein
MNGSGAYSGIPSASIAVGTDPFSVAVDNATNQVFVTNTGSNNVTVVSDQTDAQVATITVGTSPYGVAYDWATDEIYVANGGSDNVTVISGTTLGVVATVDVGSSPIGVVADPTSGKVYVADSGSTQVSVISDTTHSVVATVPAGTGPYGVALDNTTNEIFVTNGGSNNITVIDASTDSPITSIPAAAPSVTLEGIAYDAAERLIWAGGGDSFAVVVDPTNLTLVGYLTADPAGVAYDPDTGAVCVTNTANYSFQCMSSAWIPPTVQLTFAESGLPAGIPWTVTLGHSGMDNATVVSSRSEISIGVSWLWYYASDYSYWIPPTHGYVATPPSGSEPMGTSIVVNVSFAPISGTYAVVFAEAGLPIDTRWSVDLNGTLNSSVSPSNSFRLTNGTNYPFTVAGLSHFAPTPSAGTVSVAGSDVTTTVQFGPITWFSVWFNETGLPTGTSWSLVLNGTVIVSSSAAISFQEPRGTYAYSVGSVAGYSASPSSGSVSVTGQPVSIPLVWSPVRLEVSFLASGLPLGTSWSVTLGGQVRSTVAPTIDFAEAAGIYNFAVGGPSGYRTDHWTGTVQVATENQSVPVPWTQVTYNVRFDESGLPTGTSWEVDLQEVHQYLNATGSGGTISFDLHNGSYLFAIQGPATFLVEPPNGQLNLSGSDRDLSIQFFESGSVGGSVTPASASLSIGGAGIPVNGGRFNVSELPGAYAIEVSASGYQPTFANVTVSPGQSTWFNVSLASTSTSSASTLTGGLPYAAGGFAVGALVGALATGAWWVRRRNRGASDPIAPPKVR